MSNSANNEHESRQEEAIRHLAEGLKALAEAHIHDGSRTAAPHESAGKALRLANHVLALVAVDETETDDGAVTP